MSTKYKSFHERIKLGNELAEKIKNYLNDSFVDCNLVKSTLDEDKKEKIDYRLENTDKTFQFKIRESGNDLIYESTLIYPSDTDNLIAAKKFTYKSGRDLNCKASYYVTKPSNQDKVYIIKCKCIKNHVVDIIKNSQMIKDTFVEELINYSKDLRNKSYTIKTFPNGEEIKFKIDEGYNSQYGKILVFIPISAIKPSCVIDMQKKNDKNFCDLLDMLEKGESYES